MQTKYREYTKHILEEFFLGTENSHNNIISKQQQQQQHRYPSIIMNKDCDTIHHVKT